MRGVSRIGVGDKESVFKEESRFDDCYDRKGDGRVSPFLHVQ